MGGMKSRMAMATACVALFVMAFVVWRWTSNWRARRMGGEVRILVAPGKKVVSATWKETSLWVLTRPMRHGESPEQYELREYSSFGVMEGRVILVEDAKATE
jgi:hypothetical protein